MPGHAIDLMERDTARFLSSTAAPVFVGLGLGLPLLRDGGTEGRRRSLHAFEALAASVALSEGLKRLTRARRPGTNERDSFPSGHATAVFAVATAASRNRSKEAPYWYTGAALIAASRVRLKRHHVRDVIAGAALGHFTARWILSRDTDDRRISMILPVVRGYGLSYRRAY